MQDIINKKLKEEGFLYVEEILNEVSPFLSEYKSWQLEQSIIKDLDRKIVCRRVFDNNQKLEGYKVVIETENEEYILFILKNLVSLEKLYCYDDFSFKEFKSIYCDDSNIKVYSKYQENNCFSEYTKVLRDDYFCFKEIMENLKLIFYNSKNYQRKK